MRLHRRAVAKRPARRSRFRLVLLKAHALDAWRFPGDHVRMDRRIVLNQYRMNLAYAHRLVGDLDDAQMATQAQGVLNHPAWVLGHLALTCDFALKMMDDDPLLAETWQDLFGWDSQPRAQRSLYPDRRTLLAALNEGHGCVAECFARLPDALFEGQSPFAEARREKPTLGDLLLYLLCTHEGIHLGQLSAWRRAQGLPAV